MAKKKSSFGTFDPSAITQGALAKLGSDEAILCGVPVPSLAMQYLLNSTVLPVGRIMEVYGEPGAGKSTFLYELMRWFLEAGGYCYLGETEQKDSTSLRRAVFAYDFNKLERVIAKYDTSFEGWTHSLQDAITYFDDAYNQVGPVFPVLYGIDAVTSVETESSIEDYSDKGEIKTGYARLALHLAKFLRTLPAMYCKKPYMLVFLNHVKKDTSGGYGPKNILPGGSALYYGSHLILELSSTAPRVYANKTVKYVTIKIAKNGVQKQGESFIVPMEYWTLPDPLNPEQRLQQVMYDWYSADIKFLLDYMNNSELGLEKRKAVKAILDLNKGTGKEACVWSEALGIPEMEPLSLHEAGKVLHNNKEVMRKLQGYFITTDSIAFTAGTDYNSLLEKASQEQRDRYRAISDALYKQITKEELNKEE